VTAKQAVPTNGENVMKQREKKALDLGTLEEINGGIGLFVRKPFLPRPSNGSVWEHEPSDEDTSD
jgi:hypothetical protein